MKLRLIALLLLLTAAPLGMMAAQADAQFQQIPQWCGASNPNCPVGPVGGYQNGQLVKFDRSVFICTISPGTCTDSPAISPSQWRSMAGTQEWLTGTTYQAGTMVVKNGTMFTALVPNVGLDPAGGLNAQTWQARGISPTMTWVSDTCSGAGCASDIQAAINNTLAGGIVQLGCVQYPVTTTITIDKAITLQGCGTGGMQDASGIVGTRLTGSAGVTLITVSTVQGVVIRDLAMAPTGSGTGIRITTSGGLSASNINDRTIIERVWSTGGAFGVVGDTGRVRGTMIAHSYFSQQTSAGVSFGGAFNPGGNCDSGGYTITDNQFTGNATAGSDGMRFLNSSAVTLVGNAVINYGRDAVQFSTSTCAGRDTSQIQIVGNQLEAGNGGRYGLRFEAGHFSSVMVGQNYLSGSTGGGMYVAGPSSNYFTLTGNTFRAFSASAVPALTMDNVSGVSITGNSVIVGQGATATNAVLLTNMSVVSITGNNVGVGGFATNGFNIAGTLFCSAGNIFNSGVTNNFAGTGNPIGGC